MTARISLLLLRIANIGIYPIEMVWVNRQTALVLLASRADDTEAQLTPARLLPHPLAGRAPRR